MAENQIHVPTLNFVLGVIREHARKFRTSRDFYNSDYIAPALERLPGVISDAVRSGGYAASFQAKVDELARLRAEIETLDWDNEEQANRICDLSNKADEIEEELRDSYVTWDV